MANLDLLMRSLKFIEEHLEDAVAVQTEDIAAECYASKSALEKVFKYTIHFSVHDYIIRRKMIRAARLMIEKPALSILDIAVQFGYSSHEAFTRTFSQVWNCNPSDFKKRYTEKGREHSAELFPKITGFIQFLINLVKYGNENYGITILEGICIFAYYYDIPFEETLRRHQTRWKRFIRKLF